MTLNKKPFLKGKYEFNVYLHYENKPIYIISYPACDLSKL